ncbi:hypothetical protein ACQXXB_09400 [Aeromonas veronii]|uniref:hypothetical protein n=1 Tax=Aeromonas veronii TaxID=654 RepID=UPI003D206508
MTECRLVSLWSMAQGGDPVYRMATANVAAICGVFRHGEAVGLCLKWGLYVTNDGWQGSHR